MASSPTHARRGLRLERVLGMSATSRNCVAVNPADEHEVAYPAGCVVVLYCSKLEKQRAYMRMAKPVACLAYSRDGKFLAVGEKGHNPAITVWDVASHVRVAELKGHRFGVSCLSFAPNGKRLASVGFEHDDTLVLWDWPKERAQTKVKLAETVLAIDFNAKGHTLVSAGEKHVRFWEIVETLGMDPDSDTQEGPKAENTVEASTSVVSLEEHQAGIMPDYKDATFTDVVCDRDASNGSTYLVSRCGSLICLGSNRLMEKWVYLEAESAFSVSLSQGKLLCACSAGTIRVFEADTFDFVATLPLPELGGPRVASISDGGATVPSGEKSDNGDDDDNDERRSSNDTLGAIWAAQGTQVVSLYSDRKFYVWDASNLDAVRPKARLLAHPTSVTGVASMRAGIIATCADDTILRFWRVGSFSSKKKSRTLQGPQWDSPLSQELLRELDLGPGPGFRALALSADSQLVAAGDRNGGLVIYDLEADVCVLRDAKAHAGEILNVVFSPRMRTRDGKGEYHFLATAARDREVHIYELVGGLGSPRVSAKGAAQGPTKARHVQTLKDHSAIVTAVRFSVDGERLLSTGGDKTIVLSVLGLDGRYARQKSVNVPYGTIHDVDVDASNKYFCTSGQDKKINIWSLSNGKSIRSYKPEGDPGELTKVLLDPAGMYCATGSHDKAIRLLDFYSGDCLAKSAGHGEPITGLAFTSDCKRLVSVSRDGCVFVWRLAPEIHAAIKERKRELDHERALASASQAEDQENDKKAVRDANTGEMANPGLASGEATEDADQDESLFFARSQLPTWAKTQPKRDEGSAGGDDEDLDSSEEGNIGELDEREGQWDRRARNHQNGENARLEQEVNHDNKDNDEEDGEEEEQEAEEEEEERKEATPAEQDDEKSLELDDLASTSSTPSDGGPDNDRRSQSDNDSDEEAGRDAETFRQALERAGDRDGKSSRASPASTDAIRSLAQERAALKRQEAQQDTEDAVKRMRAKLKTMGLLKATIELKKEKQRERMQHDRLRQDEGGASHVESGAEKESDTEADTLASGSPSSSGARAKPRPLSTAVAWDEAGAIMSPLGSGRARAAVFRERIEEDDAIFPPPAPLEPPTPLSPKGRQPDRSPRRAHAVPSLVPVPEEVLTAPTLEDLPSTSTYSGATGHKMRKDQPATGPKSMAASTLRPGTSNSQISTLSSGSTLGAPLRSAEEARSACELALNQVRAALSHTADVFRQVESLDANLTESLTRSQGADAFAATVLETSRSHVRDLMTDFKSQLNSVVSHEVSSITSAQGGGMPSAFPADGNGSSSSSGSASHNPLNRSMFLGSMPSVTSSEMAAVMDRLTNLTSLLEQQVSRKPSSGE
ncbi:WD repeat-containing protein 62 [Hondaea fermentalgiana]|uniref:WD repeat-containing protein 62 n=1 Tax=Hondaea fermentalgiana TaxID=2315210 RepID=A0A2R5GFS1_9STRA|nr:WD repeat-containing protein 62 [Hondaea fermentalgiana]|eukprot:GBG27101.1 WD repeat-containing protein 62 [Hondaea fermentalgiana]